MRIGRTPPLVSASAARKPAGPAPTTTTTGSTTGNPMDDDRHAGLDGRRTGAHAAAVGEAHPAVLTGCHETKARTIGFTELEPPQGGTVQQNGREQQVALAGLGRLAINRKRNWRAATGNKASKQTPSRNPFHPPTLPTPTSYSHR